MKTVKRGRLDIAMKKALKAPVTQKVSDEISEVLNVDTNKLDAQTAIVFAQVAKAIKGDKSAFEMICEMSKKVSQAGAVEDSFVVEIKVVD